MDEEFILSEDQIKLEQETENLAKRKRISNGDDEKIKKKDREFDEKKNIAREVSKYPNIYDISNKGFLDKQLQQSTWEQIAVAVGLSVEKCTAHWHSLKRSAKYYAIDQKIVYKSGANSEGILTTRYRLEWPHRDVMAFYTPPSLRDLANRKPKATSTSLNLPTHIFAANSPLSDSTAPTDSLFYGENEDQSYYQTPSPKPREEKDQLAESVSLMANTLSAYFQCKTTPVKQENQSPPKVKLKYMDMWTNFDRLVSKLDEDAVDDLNIDIMNLIGVALKKKRQNS